MAERGGQPGNDNGHKGKPWAGAIRFALAERERTGKPGALRDLAATMIDKALEGDMAALKELGDRLDGKPAQAIVGDSEQPVSITFSWRTKRSHLPHREHDGGRQVMAAAGGRLHTDRSLVRGAGLA